MVTRKNSAAGRSRKGKLRYAVVGLGHIAQVAVLPAFANAEKNSQLTALVSGNPRKLKQLSKRYQVPHTYSYEEYDECLSSGTVDAVYIALPNSLHRDYAVRAARAGVHVLCEKPMAVTTQECQAMLRAAQDNDVKLMTAYRLHFEEANLKAIAIVQSGKLGKPRLFNSVFTMQVRGGNIRLDRELGGGVLYDIGIYCINAARYLFRAEPIEVTAFGSTGETQRFDEVPEMVSAVLRFPNDCLASFTTSFGAADVSTYRVVGTQGDLVVDQAYEYVEEITHTLTVKGKKREQTFARRDQFAAELIYFSKCVLTGRNPEPGGKEGLADVRIIQALRRSAENGGKPVKLNRLEHKHRPSLKQEIRRSPVQKPDLIDVSSPSA